jgi:hypothetical protein
MDWWDVQLSPECARIMAREEAAQRAREEEWIAQRQRERDAIKASLRPKPSTPAPPPCRVVRDRGVESIVRLDLQGSSGRKIHGVASTPTISSNGNAYTMAGCVVRMPIPLLSNHHERGQIGQVVLVRKEPSRIYVQATLDDDRGADHAWGMIEDGTLRGLSIRAEPMDECVVEGVRFFGRWRLLEVSLVKTPGNSDCYCEPMT